MIYVARILAIILALTVISKSYLDFKKKQESLILFLFWTITWVCIIYLALFPSVIDLLIKTFGGNKTGTGTVFGMSLVFVFFVTYRVYGKSNRIERNLNQIVRELGLKGVNNPPNNQQKK